ncbi:MAG: hypothetical protein HY718_04385, partial [Planctomycetes bacterium]|nr:hypothetical protein [Planctomycetota bacterium]
MRVALDTPRGSAALQREGVGGESRVAVMARVWAAMTAGLAGVAWGATPLHPPVVHDMVMLGQGPCHATNVRHVLLNGDYLHCSGEPGLETVRITDGYHLQFVDDYCGTQQQPNGSAVRDNYLYLANWNPSDGLLVFSVANPGGPSLMRTLGAPLHTWDVSIYGNLMYLTIGAELDSGFQTYDITTPGQPVLQSTYLIGDRLASNIARYGNYLYQSHKEELRVYDGSNPAVPQHVNTIRPFASSLGLVEVRGNYLFMLGRKVVDGQVGGLWVFSLADPRIPANVKPGMNPSWTQPEPRDLCFLGDYCIVPCSGSGIYTLNAATPTNVVEVSHWYLPPLPAGTIDPITVAGTVRYAYIGTTTIRNNNPPCCNQPPDQRPPDCQCCEDFTCPDYGARLYSAQILAVPPVILAVTPNPDVAGAERTYSRQVLLQEDASPVTFSLLQGPLGAQVSNTGLVSGWRPGLSSLGTTQVFQVRASNSDGTDTESWSVTVQLNSDCDFDDDGDVDQDDYGHFQTCITGQGDAGLLADCHDAVLDDFDGDVDATDMALFVACLSRSGPGIAAPA